MLEIGKESLAAGMTLLELLIVVGIIALVSMLSFSSFAPQQERLNLRRLTQNIVLALEAAKSGSQRHGQTTTFFLDVEGKKYGVEHLSPTSDIPPNIDALLTAAKEISKQPYRGKVHFYPDGTSSGGTLTLSNKLTSSVIQIHWLTGHIQYAQ